MPVKGNVGTAMRRTLTGCIPHVFVMKLQRMYLKDEVKFAGKGKNRHIKKNLELISKGWELICLSFYFFLQAIIIFIFPSGLVRVRKRVLSFSS
jgi:hypothetical protein